jgi:hypothetical protein
MQRSPSQRSLPPKSTPTNKKTKGPLGQDDWITGPIINTIIMNCRNTAARDEVKKNVSRSDDHDVHNDDDDDSVSSVLQMLGEKRQLASSSPSITTPAAAVTTTTSAAVAAAPPPAEAAATTLRGTNQRRRKRLFKKGGNSDDDDDDDENLPKPGAVFVPGIDFTCDTEDIDDDCNDWDENSSSRINSKDEELPAALEDRQSSTGTANTTESSVYEQHLAVAVAVDEDKEREEQRQQVDALAIPIAESAKTATMARATTLQLWRTKKALLLLAAFLTIGTVALTSILLRASMNHDDTYAASETTSYRENLGIRQEIGLLLGEKSPQLLESPASPYAQALDWIMHKDPMALVPAEDANFFQRYITAYLYYATTVKGPWRSCNPAVGDETEFCHLSFPDERYDDNRIPAIRWLSAVHECNFMGITCND